MAEDLAAILFDLPYKAPSFRSPAPMDPKIYPSYAGTYDTSEIFGEGATMNVVAEGDRLWYRSNTLYDSLGLPIHIYPESRTAFFDKTGTARYVFIVGDGGKAEAIEITDGSESFRFPRLR